MKVPDIYADGEGAELYDIAFDFGRKTEADFAELCVKRFGGRAEGAVLDLACGAGHFLQEMATRGWRPAGVDVGPHMIDVARRRLGMDCILETACMSRFTLDGPFDIATCWYDSLGYLLSNEKIVEHLRSVARVLADSGLYLLDVGFSTWADPMWSQPEADWRPNFDNGWSASRGAIEVYHDGCDGPPCDSMAHVHTEYMYFRATDQASGTVSEHTYEAPKRALHPQELTALVSAAGVLETVGWYTGSFDLNQPLENADGRGRGLVVLRKRGR